jgi:23S rRNA (pseudouridine1915-N3)-methyltransferase
MKLIVVAVGHRMPEWVNLGFDEYARRMPREMPVVLKPVKPEPRAGESSEAATRRVVEAEGRRIAAALPRDCMRVALDERGTSCTTRELASLLERWRMSGRDVAFIIGGADGLAAGFKRDADMLWSLSPLTLPHGLARVVLGEQIYRAYSILTNHPYHRE